MIARRNSVALVAALIGALVTALGITAAAGSAQGSYQVSFNTDTAGLNDKSFNNLGNIGR